MRGVYKRKGLRRAKPFCITAQKKGERRRALYFATEEEAEAALLAQRDAKEAEKREKRGRLAEKRERDVARNGNSSSMERSFALALKAEWERRTGGRAVILNDGTVADMLFGLFPSGTDGLLPVQLKTTEKAVEGNQNAYKFQAVLGYETMPVLCWREDKQDAWVYDGKVLQERGKDGLVVTPGGKNCKMAMGRGMGMEEIVSFLREELGKEEGEDGRRWERVGEEEARWQLKSETQKKEMKGIEEYKRRFQSRGPFYWPDGQNTHVDLEEGRRGGGGGAGEGKGRLQFKTVREVKGKAGFTCSTFTRAGKDESGRQLVDPYPSDAFDFLVAVWFDEEERAHFWRFPKEELVKRGVMSSETEPGKTGIRIYGPVGVGKHPDEKARKRAETWSLSFYES